MSHIQKIRHIHPMEINVDLEFLIQCIEACVDCAQSCSACADACLGEENIHELVPCIRLDLDCADICEVASRGLSREVAANWELTRGQLEAAYTACRLCQEECQRHAHRHDHCALCAESCRQCEEACRQLLETLPD